MYLPWNSASILVLAMVAGVEGTSASFGRRAPRKCTDFLIHVAATAHAKQIPTKKIPQDLSDPTVLQAFVLSEASSGFPTLLETAGTVETSGDYNMSVRYCEPTKIVPGRANTIQYLQHAITMTKDYWNGLGYPKGYDGDMYSYIDVAADNGYATLSVDNLGSGNSSHPDPILVVQMPLQVEIMHQIIDRLRAGTIGGPIGAKKWEKVIYAGHSYGSISGNALVATYPADVDALVLTGYTPNFAAGIPPLLSGVAVPAALASPRFAGLDAGYLAQTSVKGRQYGLYTVGGVGGFDPGALRYDFDHEGTVALGELATLFYGLTPANDFKGSVFVVTGKQDAIVCNTLLGADCGSGATSQPAQGKKFFLNAKDYSFFIPDRTGHNANIHYSSPDSFKKIIAYLQAQGF